MPAAEVGSGPLQFVPLVIKRRHRSRLIVPPAGASAVKAASTFDLPLIRTLGKAFYWQRMIDTGAVAAVPHLTTTERHVS